MWQHTANTGLEESFGGSGASIVPSRLSRPSQGAPGGVGCSGGGHLKPGAQHGGRVGTGRPGSWVIRGANRQNHMKLLLFNMFGFAKVLIPLGLPCSEQPSAVRA